MSRKICMLGLGYIGLPTASMFATHGWQVVGVDTNPSVVNTLNNGGIHIQEEGLGEIVRRAYQSEMLSVRSSPVPADVFIIAVPTPHNIDKTADMRFVRSATQSIVPHLKTGNLVVLESTSPPRTTIDLVQPILETSGLKAGIDFMLVYSPERVLPGRILTELIENARVIGGIDRRSAEAGKELYGAFVKGDIILTDATTAEMVKLMENTFRDVNIALANEFALISEQIGINVWEAIQIANRHPRVKILNPGPGVGGHCIAVDPWFLVEAAPEQSPLIRQARMINDAMPEYVLQKITALLGKPAGQVIACLGVTFKPDVDDTRESPALEIVKRLQAMGYQTRVYDPYISNHPDLPGVFSGSISDCLAGANLALLLVDHKAFKQLTPDALKGMRDFQVLDTRNCLPGETFTEAGIHYQLLGSSD